MSETSTGEIAAAHATGATGVGTRVIARIIPSLPYVADLLTYLHPAHL